LINLDNAKYGDPKSEACDRALPYLEIIKRPGSNVNVTLPSDIWTLCLQTLGVGALRGQENIRSLQFPKLFMYYKNREIN
jgi:hypothetical protein